MSFLDGLLGGGAGGSPIEGMLMQVLSSQMGGQTGAQAGAQPGGQAGGVVGTLISAFEQNGMGHIAQSWAGDGPNHPVSADQVHQALGADQVQAMADQTGIPKQDLLTQLAQMLPGIVERATQGRTQGT